MFQNTEPIYWSSKSLPLGQGRTVEGKSSWHAFLSTTANLLVYFSTQMPLELEGYFKKVPEVKAVYFFEEQSIVYLWCKVSKRSREIYNKVYDVEREILRDYPNPKFDFHVFAADQPYQQEKFLPNQVSLLFKRW